MTPLPPYDGDPHDPHDPRGSALDTAPLETAGGTALAGMPGAGYGGPGAAGSGIADLPLGSPPAGGPGGVPSAGSAAAAPLTEAEIGPLNLARRPFINTRPVVRVAAILWLLGLALLAANVALFMGYLNASQETRTRLASRQRELDAERGEVQKLRDGIATLHLDQQNREVAFLNRMIDDRTFSWSLLFDRMADVLPDQVRLLRLTPTSLVQKETESALLAGREAKPLPVVLSMSCEAKDDESVLQFVDNLFAHPAFTEPNLASEQREDTGLLKFELTVQYLPNPPRRSGAAPRSGRSGSRAGRIAPAPAPDAPPAPVLGENTGLPPAHGANGANTAGVPPPAPASAAGAGLVRVAPPPPAAEVPGEPEAHPLGQPPGYRPSLVPRRPRRPAAANTATTGDNR